MTKTKLNLKNSLLKLTPSTRLRAACHKNNHKQNFFNHESVALPQVDSSRLRSTFLFTFTAFQLLVPLLPAIQECFCRQQHSKAVSQQLSDISVYRTMKLFLFLREPVHEITSRSLHVWFSVQRHNTPHKHLLYPQMDILNPECYSVPL